MARVDNLLHEFDVLKTLQAACDHEGLELWASYPTIYHNGAPPQRPELTRDAANVSAAPRLLHEGVWDASLPPGTQLALELGCPRKAPRADGPAFDNLCAMRRP